MLEQTLLWFVTLCTIYSFSTEMTDDLHDRDADVLHHLGHLHPFGSSGPFHSVDVVDSFPRAADSFLHYVQPLRPLKMSGAARLSSAFHKWATDDYFLQTVVNTFVAVETSKKENRSSPLQRMHFHEFLRRYNFSEHYMVDGIPLKFRSDVMLPGSLQCPQLYNQMLVDIIMWMSSGGTSSVVHTDSSDNIICVFRGQKSFILVDPSLHADKIFIDHPEGGYSSIDVDRVDYRLYPGLADVEYYQVSLSAGDCLYVPYKWHCLNDNLNTRSVDNTCRPLDIDVMGCSHHHHDDRDDVIDLSLTLDKVTVRGNRLDGKENVQSLREWFARVLHDQGASTDEFVSLFTSDVAVDGIMSLTSGNLRRPLHEIFRLLDKDTDARVSLAELTLLTDDEWLRVEHLVSEFDEMIDDQDLSTLTSCGSNTEL